MDISIFLAMYLVPITLSLLQKNSCKMSIVETTDAPQLLQGLDEVKDLLNVCAVFPAYEC